jgi:hypothetical protein
VLNKALSHRDAWAKRKGYASQEAKQLYVESLLKVSQRRCAFKSIMLIDYIRRLFASLAIGHKPLL